LNVSWRAVTHAEGLLRHSESRPEYYELTTLRGLPAGNIAYAGGCLVVAGAKEMVVYVPAGRQLPRLERDPQAKGQPAKLFRLALAQIENGQRDDAEAMFAKLDKQAPAVERAAWKSLIRERTNQTPILKRESPAVTERPSASP